MNITLWYMLNPNNKKYIYNHFEDGINFNNLPTIKKDSTNKEFESQKFWSKQIWRKKYAKLINGKIVNTHYPSTSKFIK